MVQTLVPVLSFNVNHEYIKAHLCRSLTQPEFKDCDGFCYLKKQIHDHDDKEMDHSSNSTYGVKIPFLYLVEIRSKELQSPLFSKDEHRFKNNEPFPNQVFLEIISPPPKS